MASELMRVVSETWERALDADRQVAVAHVVDMVIEEHPDLVQHEADALARQALMRWVKQLARAEADASQLSLFGLPAVIAIPLETEEDEAAGDEYVYMRTAKATFPEIERGKVIRIDNVRRAQAKLDQYSGAIEKVRPYMEGTPKTLAEALSEMQAA